MSKPLSFYLFADDTNIYFEASDLFTLQKVMNRELRKIKKWFAADKLALNIDKTIYIIFHSPSRKLTEPFVLKFGRKKIFRTDHVKFLGILLDETLGWKPHLLELSRKLARSVGIFYKSRHYIPLDTLKSVYYAVFYPFLTYNITVWGTASETYPKLVQITQKKWSGL